MSPQTNGAAVSLGSRKELQFKGFCASGPPCVDSSCQRAEADQQQRPPVQLGCQLTQDQAEAGGANGRQH